MKLPKSVLRERTLEITNRLVSPGSRFEIDTIDIKGSKFRFFKNTPVTLDKTLMRKCLFENKVAVIYEGESWTYKRLYDYAELIAATLIKNYKIQKNDRVAIAARNCPEWLSVFIAISFAGAIAVPLNSWGKASELEYGIKDCGARIVFCDADRLVHLRDQLKNDQALSAVIIRTNNRPIEKNIVLLDDILAAKNNIVPLVDSVCVMPDDIAMIMYSSGTTGYPKGVCYTHRNITQALYIYEFLGELTANLEADRINKFVGKGLVVTHLLATPLFHGNGLLATALSAVSRGEKIVMMYKWNVPKALEYVASEHITSMKISPAMTLQLLDCPEFDSTDTTSLFSIGSGGSTTPARVYNLLKNKCPDVLGSGGYGTTETGGSVAALYGDLYLDTPMCAGLINVLFDVHICDNERNVLPIGKPGEIAVRGITVAAGYWNKPEQTREVFVDDWYYTGDIGYIDDDGYLFITDRLSDMVIRGGENIYCVEVENVLYGYSDIAEVAAFGVPHEVLGEELAVAVYPRPGSQISKEDVVRYVSGKIARFKVPTHVFFYKDSLPRGASGKIHKKTLKADAISKLEH